MDSDATRRCFVGIPIPPAAQPPLVRHLHHLQAMPENAARKIRPVRGDNLHITLKFLGSTRSDQCTALLALLREAAQTIAPLDIEIRGLGHFPEEGEPRILFAQVGAGLEAVKHWCRQAEALAESLGFEPEERPPHPHITLARVQHPKPGGAVYQWLEKGDEKPIVTFTADRWTLFESKREGEKSFYIPFESVPLGAQSTIS